MNNQLESPIVPSERYVDLAEAAGILGVHFTTLRRWADNGKVPHIRTPGGRRRFSVVELAKFVQSLDQGGNVQVPNRPPAQIAVAAQPHLLGRLTEKEKWITLMTDEQRLDFQRSGQRLMGLLMQYISRTDTGETFLTECRQMGRDYGLICFKASMSIGDTVQAFLHFRRSVLASIHETSLLSQPSDPESQRMFERTSDFLDIFLLEVVEGYCHPQK